MKSRASLGMLCVRHSRILSRVQAVVKSFSSSSLALLEILRGVDTLSVVLIDKSTLRKGELPVIATEETESGEGSKRLRTGNLGASYGRTCNRSKQIYRISIVIQSSVDHEYEVVQLIAC